MERSLFADLIKKEFDASHATYGSTRITERLNVEGLKDYIKIYTSKHEKPIITLNSLKNFERHLPPDRFSRIHKSYIVGHEHIKTINKSQVFIQDKNIPIGESFRILFFTKMEDLRI